MYSSADNGRSFRDVRAVIWVDGGTVMSGQASKIRGFCGCAACSATKHDVRMGEIVNKDLSARTMSAIFIVQIAEKRCPKMTELATVRVSEHRSGGANAPGPRSVSLAVLIR